MRLGSLHPRHGLGLSAVGYGRRLPTAQRYRSLKRSRARVRVCVHACVRASVRVCVYVRACVRACVRARGKQRAAASNSSRGSSGAVRRAAAFGRPSHNRPSHAIQERRPSRAVRVMPVTSTISSPCPSRSSHPPACSTAWPSGYFYVPGRRQLTGRLRLSGGPRSPRFIRLGRRH